MRFVVLGARGQLGQELLSRLPGEVVGLDRVACDLARPGEARMCLEAHLPDVVVNCAAYNQVDRAEAEPEAAFAVNAWGVRELARWCADRGRLLVHFSSDHVFGLDEGRHRPYGEADAPGPVGVYGLSKLAGEHLIRALCPRHLIVRTCGLYGSRGLGGKGNFVETMLRLARERPVVRVVADQVCTPTAAGDLAGEVVGLIQGGATGVIHRTSAGECSWHEFACAVFRLAGLAVRVEPITSAQYGAAARRPSYSVLGSTLPPLRPWREALADYLGAARPAEAA